MDILNRGKLFLIATYITILLNSCINNDPISISNNYKIKSEAIIGSNNYIDLYKKINDTIETWVLNKFQIVEAESRYRHKVDSLMCISSDSTRLITCMHIYVDLSDAVSDNLQFYYGEKINNNWFFFRGESVVILRSMIKDHLVNQPLTYQELHEVALKEVYSGYLDRFGNINNAWFESYFENVGWCIDCKTKEDYKKSRLESAIALWANRDTTQPIKLLPKKDTVIP